MLEVGPSAVQVKPAPDLGEHQRPEAIRAFLGVGFTSAPAPQCAHRLRVSRKLFRSISACLFSFS